MTSLQRGVANKSDPMGVFIEGIFRKLFLAVYLRGHNR